ncbi:MAG: hypothetical protein KC549_09805 [Myxococcales bacterium]|nr:hypothetical protein [Myxococcales bacterium]MCB9544285.1 hypothetical protein [Myxococcales bacterium]
MTTLVCIVEGHGEVEALPVLVRRVAGEILGRWDVAVPSPIRLPRGRIVGDGAELGRALGLASIQLKGGPGGILVVIDADDDAACQLGPTLQSRCQALRPDLTTAVVLAEREYEAWFVAARSSLAARGVLRATDEAVSETLRDCKGWVDRHTPNGYSERLDQARLSAQLDLAEAKSASSFRKLVREIGRLVTRPAP